MLKMIVITCLMVEKIMFWVKYPRSLQKHREGCIRKNIKSLILQIVESVDVVFLPIHRKTLFNKGNCDLCKKEKINKKHDKMLSKCITVINRFTLLLKGRICHGG